MSEPRLTPEPFWGVGPRIGLVTLIHFLAAVAIDAWKPDWFRIQGLSMPAASILSGVFIVLGIAIYLISLRHLLAARREGRLATTGPYRFLRHPLYAIGLFLLTPGVCILFRSWIVITTPVSMALAIAYFLPREESKLEMAFGDAYRAYRARTGAVIPRSG